MRFEAALHYISYGGLMILLLIYMLLTPLLGIQTLRYILEALLLVSAVVLGVLGLREVVSR